nr:MFS transporter [Planosporangium thailandense]
MVACLAFAAMTGSVVAGLGSPIVLEVSVEREVSISSAQWTLIITLLVGVICTPVLSRLADGDLKRRVLIGALLATAVGCAVGALVPTFGGLLTGRALQGFGYAMVPLTVSIARDHLHGVVLARTMGVLSTSIAVGVGVGNPVMGLCVLVYDYRAAFGFAFVVSAGGALWAWRRVPVAGVARHKIRLDPAGAVLLGGGLAGVLLAVARGQVWGWSAPLTVGLGAGGVVLLASWAVVELRVAAPMVDLRLACARGLVGVNLTAVLLGINIFGGVAVVLLLAQRPVEDGVGFGYTVFETGLLMLPMAVASLVCPAMARWLERWMPPRLVLPLGSALVTLSFGGFAVWHDRTWHIAAMMGLMGMGIGIAYSAMPALIVARTPAERTASATGINQVLRLMGGAVGAAVMTAVLARYTPPGMHNPLEQGYVAALAVACLAGVVAVLVGCVLVPACDDVHRAEDVDTPVRRD